jgi:hypothetical protein
MAQGLAASGVVVCTSTAVVPATIRLCHVPAVSRVMNTFLVVFATPQFKYVYLSTRTVYLLHELEFCVLITRPFGGPFKEKTQAKNTNVH